MKSIKNKLFVQIGLLVVLLITLLMIAYSYLFEPFYMVIVKNELLSYYDQVNRIDLSEYDNLREKIDQKENMPQIDIFIHDPEGALLYTTKDYTFSEEMMAAVDILPVYRDGIPSPIDVIKEEKINDQINFVWSTDVFIGIKHLLIIGRLDNGNRIVLRTQLLSTETNIIAANRFAPVVGIILFIIGMGIAYTLSTSFTRPLLKMNKATVELKQLNFHATCPVTSKDELGELAQSINDMSVALANTIEALHVSNQELECEIEEKVRIDEKRKQLLNNVSHELKTPLALMQGYAEGLKLNVAKNYDRVDFYCDVIMDEAQKMNRLVQDLLDINQLQFGDTTFNRTEFEIVAFVEHLLEKYQDRFEASSMHVSFKPIPPSIIYADPLKLELVVTNYLNNAIHYADARKTIEVRMLEHEKTVRIEIYNTASKIPEEELNKLWDSFYKLSKSRTRESSGHGLGLSIVKAIQKADGSGFGARNEEGGVVFWLEVHKAANLK